ncbi:MAG: T9SS C-terminal target domain-containing protein, partial [Bacteroidetes bacterium]
LIGGYPSGLVDRHYNDVDPSEFKQYYYKRIDIIPEASVAVRNINFIDSTREITFEVEVAFATNISNPDYRFNAVIVEDSVTGTSSGYDQANYYSSQANNIDLVGVDGVNWKDLPNPVPAAQMVYNHVARAILGGFSGSIQDTLPSSIEVGVPYTRSYSYTLPSGYNENHIKVVGLLLNNATGEIVNAYETSLLSPTYPSGVFVKDLAEDNFNIYPNPNNGNFILSAKNLTGNERLVVFNALGEVVFSENITASFSEVSLKNAHPGIYFVKIISDQGNIVRKIVVQ